MKRQKLHMEISELDQNELKTVLRDLIRFVDEEDEVLYGKVKKEMKEQKMITNSMIEEGLI